MSASPLISVILPAWNAAATIRRAIDSIVRQTFRDWELIVIDDGSTDGTASVVAAIARQEKRVRLCRRAHGGLVASLNAGLEAARGTLIARMDADDVSHAERLAAQVDLLQTRPAVQVASCLVDFSGNRLHSLGFARYVAWLNSIVSPDAIHLNRFVESPVAHPTVMFRREVVEEYGGYRAGPFPEDYELWLRWMEAGARFAKVPRLLLEWHDSPGRLSRSDRRYDVEAFYDVKARFLARQLQRAAGGRAVWIWGAGRVTRRRVRWLEREGVAVAGFIDVHPGRWGRLRDGRPVVGPQATPPPRAAIVVGYVAKWGARDLIREHLNARGFEEGADFWMAA